jgi:hypothetical protein
MQARFGGTLAALFLALGCSDSNKPLPPPVSKTIGSTGGTVMTTDGNAGVSIPQGALMNNTNISVGQSAVTPPSDTRPVGAPYQFGPNGTVFPIPVTVTLPFGPLPQGTTVADLTVWTADDRTPNAFTPIGGNVSADGKHFEVQTTHFSVCVVGRQIPSGTPPPPGSCGPAFYDACATCVKTNCDAQAKQCFGNDYQLKKFTGPCAAVLQCVCNCSISNNCQCDGAADATCQPCYQMFQTQCINGTCANVCNNNSGNCNTLVNNAPVVQEIQVGQVAPTPAGGTVQDGLYYLTARTVYTGLGGPAGPTGQTDQTTVQVNGAASGTATVQIAEVKNGTSQPQNLSIQISGNQFNVTHLCPSAANETSGFTASGSQFIVFDTNGQGQVRTQTFTLQAATAAGG